MAMAHKTDMIVQVGRVRFWIGPEFAILIAPKTANKDTSVARKRAKAYRKALA
jgi:hypothetical protein